VATDYFTKMWKTKPLLCETEHVGLVVLPVTSFTNTHLDGSMQPLNSAGFITELYDSTGDVSLFVKTGTTVVTSIEATTGFVRFTSNGLSASMPYTYAGAPVERIVPITVNGMYADSSGNINTGVDSAYVESQICNYATQTLNSNTDTLVVSAGVNAILDISGNTTIRIEPTATCNTGNITVICDAAGYTLTFVGGTMKFSPYVDSTAGVITTSAVAGGIDVYSYFYDGTRIIINGTKAYE